MSENALVLATEIQLAGGHYKVTHILDLRIAIEHAKRDKPRWITYDTETTGLHLRKDKPFYAAVCWTGVVYIFPPTKRNLNLLSVLSALTKRFYPHNAIFDMCMTANIAGDAAVLETKNWADSMCLMRLVVEAVSPNDGGDSLALKKFAKKYISTEAGVYEDAVKTWLKEKKAANRKMLVALLREEKYTAKEYDARLKNGETLPDNVLAIHNSWVEAYPEPTYQDVPLDIMLPYLAADVILTDIAVAKMLPVIVSKGQVDTYAMECDLLPAVFEMVRAGFTPNRQYLIESKERVEQYVKKLYERAYELADRKFKVGQHALIKDMFTESTGVRPDSVDKPYMQKQAREGSELASIISKLRTCEKWLSTYIVKLLSDSEYDGRCYPSLNPYNPVTGRFSGDFQQMPKDALLTLEGSEFNKKNPNLPVPEEMELFHPRKSILVSGGVYNKMAFIDISQYELRWGAHYTLMFGGDINLCRAYMPYHCFHKQTGELFDEKNQDHIKRWNEKDLEGKTVWYFNEEPDKAWTPTDVHSSTTIAALPAMGHDPNTIDKETFDYWRQKGKRYNFLKFYGGGAAKAAEALEISLDHAKALNAGFEEAFPLLITYSNAVIDTAGRDGFVKNVYGRRYYLSKSYYHYKLANYLIQGGTADDFKRKLIKIYKWLKENKVMSRMVHPIHDEIILDIANGEDWILPYIKEILEDTPAVNVPIVAEVSTTDTTWEKKRKVA